MINETLIHLAGEMHAYSVRESTRAKHQHIVVHWDGRLEVVVPVHKRHSRKSVENLLRQHEQWVARHVERLRKNGKKMPLRHRGVPRQLVERNTRTLVEERLKFYVQEHGFVVGTFVLRPFKAQWGSCSREARLALHYKLSLLPRPLAEYVIVHELCHTRHFNHSATFWGLVERFCPEYKRCRKELRRYLL